MLEMYRVNVKLLNGIKHFYGNSKRRSVPGLRSSGVCGMSQSLFTIFMGGGLRGKKLFGRWSGNK